MPPTMPELDGVEHSFHDLPTGVRVHLAAAGPPDAPPVLAVHGWPQHWWSWRAVIGELAGEFRLLCPDLRGLGWSGLPDDDDFRKQRLADDQIALLDVLGIDRVRLVGHDWGGYAALLAALTAPARFSSLAALSIAPSLGATAGRPAPRLDAVVPASAGSAVRRRARHPRRPLPARDAAQRPPRRAALDARGGGHLHRRAARAGAAHASSKLYRDFLIRELPRTRSFAGRRFEMPARLVIGSREPFRPFATGFHGEIEVIDDAGHFLPEEAPAAVADQIRAM